MKKHNSSLLSGLETFLKFATHIGAVIAFLIGIYHYRATEEAKFRKAYWEKRYEVYKDLNDLTGQIANTSDTVSARLLQHEFWVMYWGSSVLLADHHVLHAMHAFGESLDRAILPDSLDVLRRKSLALGHACQTSLKETWEPLSEKTKEHLDK